MVRSVSGDTAWINSESFSTLGTASPCLYRAYALRDVCTKSCGHIGQRKATPLPTTLQDETEEYRSVVRAEVKGRLVPGRHSHLKSVLRLTEALDKIFGHLEGIVT